MKHIFFILFVVATLALQVFFLERMWLGIYVSIYIAGLLLMEVRAQKWVVLLTGFAIGASVDLLSAGAGLYTAVTGVVAMIRYPLIKATLPSAFVESGGTICTNLVPVKNFFAYVVCMLAIWSLLFFFIEADFVMPILIVVRVVANILLGSLLIFLVQIPLR